MHYYVSQKGNLYKKSYPSYLRDCVPTLGMRFAVRCINNEWGQQMRLPKELIELSKSTDVPFEPKWEFGRFSSTTVGFFGRCYESRYKGHVVRYYKGCNLGVDSSGGDSYLENRLKLFHSRPLNLGLQCYFNLMPFSPWLIWSEGRNLFASKLCTSYSNIKCYAAEKKLAEALLSQSKTIDAFVKLKDFVRTLHLGRFVLVDVGLMIYFYKKPDARILDALYQFSQVLTESTHLPYKSTHWTLPLAFLGGLLAFILALIALIIMLPRAS